jgi:hypothetical protein
LSAGVQSKRRAGQIDNRRRHAIPGETLREHALLLRAKRCALRQLTLFTCFFHTPTSVDSD